MKNRKVNGLIILVITLILFYFLFRKNYKEIIDTLLMVNLFWLFIALVFYLLYFLLDQLAIYNVLREYNKKVKFKFMIYIGIINKFFSGITPLAVGGQPMQVYELSKKGISITKGTNIMIQSYIIWQISLMLISVGAIISNYYFNFFSYIPMLRELTIIGFVINFIILGILALVSFNSNFNKLIVGFVISFLDKFKLIKNKEKKLKNAFHWCDEYYNNSRILLKNKRVFIEGIFLQSLSTLFIYLVPLFLAKAIGVDSNLNILNTIVAGSYIFNMGYYVPIPGATGGMEYAFLGFFGNFIVDYKLNALLLLWRSFTYYFPMIIGGIIYGLYTNKIRKVK